MGAKYEYCARGISFGILAIIFQITFFILYCVLVEYGTYSPNTYIFPYYNQTNFTNNTCCSPFCNLDQSTAMVLLGLGFLFSLIRCTSLYSIGFSVFLLAFTVQWAGLVIPWLFQAALKYYQPQYIYMNTSIICDVVYGAFALVISYGAVVGTISRVQILISALFGVVLFGINRLVVIHYLYVSDIGGSMTIYMFGGLFGIALLFGTLIYDKNWKCRCKCDKEPAYYQYIFAFLGAIILIIFWPSFIATQLPEHSDLQQRALVNTYYSISAAIIVTYAMSSFVTKCCKLTVLHILMGSISGAIVIASVAPLVTQIWGAILLGAFAGFSVVIFLRYVNGLYCFKVDLLGVFWTFAFSGFVGGIASAIMAALVYKTSYVTLNYDELILLYPAIIYGNLGVGSPRTAAEQGGYQMLGAVVTLGIAFVGGFLTGLLVRWLGPLDDEEYYDDSVEWRVCCNPCIPNKCEKQITTTDRSNMTQI